MVAIGQEMVREKLDVWQKSGKSEILRVHIYSSPSFLLLFCNIEILILQTYMEGMAMRGGLNPHQVWWCVKLLIQLVREILHLSGKSPGKVREF